MTNYFSIMMNRNGSGEQLDIDHAIVLFSEHSNANWINECTYSLPNDDVTVLTKNIIKDISAALEIAVLKLQKELDILWLHYYKLLDHITCDEMNELAEFRAMIEDTQHEIAWLYCRQGQLDCVEEACFDGVPMFLVNG